MAPYCAYHSRVLLSLRFWLYNSWPSAFLIVFSGKIGLPFDQKWWLKMIVYYVDFCRNIVTLCLKNYSSFFRLDITNRARWDWAVQTTCWCPRASHKVQRGQIWPLNLDQIHTHGKSCWNSPALPVSPTVQALASEGSPQFLSWPKHFFVNWSITDRRWVLE